MSSESLRHTQTIDVRKTTEYKESVDFKKKIGGREVKDRLIHSYNYSKELQKNLLGISGDVSDMTQIDSLDRNSQSRLRKLAESHKKNEEITRKGYSEKLDKFGVTYEQFQNEYNKTKNIQENKDFMENLRNLDKPLETPLLEPLDIILLLATFTTVLGKVGLNALSKGCRLVTDGAGKIFVKTETGAYLLEAKEAGGKTIQRILEKFKDKIQGVKELFEPQLAFAGGGRGKITEAVNFSKAKPNILKSEIAGEIDFSLVKNSILTNSYQFIREHGIMELKEFTKQLLRFSKELSVKHFLDEDIRIQTLQILNAIPEYLEIMGRAMSPELKKEVMLNLGKIRNTLDKIVDDKKIADYMRGEIRDIVNSLYEAKKAL